MKNTSKNKAPKSIYHIRVGGHLDQRWSEWFENLAITQQPDGTTTLSGLVADQAALYGLLIKLRDRGLPLLGLQSLPAGRNKEAKRE